MASRKRRLGSFLLLLCTSGVPVGVTSPPSWGDNSSSSSHHYHHCHITGHHRGGEQHEKRGGSRGGPSGTKSTTTDNRMSHPESTLLSSSSTTKKSPLQPPPPPPPPSSSFNNGGGMKIPPPSPPPARSQFPANPGPRKAAAIADDGSSTTSSRQSAIKGVLGKVALHFLQRVGTSISDWLCSKSAAKLIRTLKIMTARPGRPIETSRFADVLGCDGVKKEILQLVTYLHHPHKVRHVGANLPKGVLLVGPPGVGKTMMAKALAGEAEASMYYMLGGDFNGPEGHDLVRILFRRARKTRPSIVFIDEIEQTGPEALDHVLNEVDTLTTNSQVMVVASTNRPSQLDAAVIRPGRFDKILKMERPDVHGRQQLFYQLLRSLASHDDERKALSSTAAKLTPGFVGGDIQTLVNEAALHATSFNRTLVVEEDLVWAAEKRASYGVGKSQRSLVVSAVHEAGRALVATLLPGADKPSKVTIISRSSYSDNNQGQASTTASDLRDEICAVLGGRAAEEVVIGDVSRGASQDVQIATDMAREVLRIAGFSSSSSSSSGLVRSNPFSRPLTAVEEVQSILEGEYHRAKEVIIHNRRVFDVLVKELMEREVLSEGDIKAIIDPHSGATGLMGRFRALLG